MKKLLTKSVKAIFLAMLFGAMVVSAQYIGPTGTPATMNAPLPVNVSANDQMKQGGLGLSKLLIGPGSLANVDPSSASIGGSLRIGTGTIPTGPGILQINNKGGVGSNLNINMVPADGFSVYGLISNGGGIFSAKHLYAGNTSFLNTPTAAGANGAVIADRFCFSGTAGTCISGSWATGSTLLGSTNQTVRFSATNTPVAAANLTNDGTSVTLNAAGSSLTINGGTTALPNLLYLNAPITASKIAVVINKQDLQFWNAIGNRNATLYAYDLVATNLANATSDHVCADANGKLFLCGPGVPTTGAPAIDLQVNGQDNYTTTIPDSFTINDAPLVTWSVTSLGAGWTCTASNAWTGQKSSSGGSQPIAINAYGTQTFVITCVNGAQTVSDTATYTANGYYTFWANSSFDSSSNTRYTAFNQSTHPSLAGVTITATAVGSSGGGYTAYLKPGYAASCTTPINSTTLDTFGSQDGAIGTTSSRVIVAPMTSIPIQGGRGGGAQYISGALINPADATGVPTNIPGSGINPGAIFTDQNGIVRGRGGEGTVTDTNGNTVNCTGNNLNGKPGGTGRGTLNATTNYWMSVGTAATSNGGVDGAIRISW